MGPAFSEGTVNALSGGVAGAANIFTGFPFDTVKVRLQASPPGTYAGPLDCARNIVKYEGVRGASEYSPNSLWQCEDCQTHCKTCCNCSSYSYAGSGSWSIQRSCSPVGGWSPGNWHQLHSELICTNEMHKQPVKPHTIIVSCASMRASISLQEPRLRSSLQHAFCICRCTPTHWHG